MNKTVIGVTSNRQPTVWEGSIEGSYCHSIMQSEVFHYLFLLLKMKNILTG